MEKNENVPNDSEKKARVKPQKVVVYESDYKCQVYLPMGCTVIKDCVCADFVITPVAMPCKENCDRCERDFCTKEVIQQIVARGNYATRELCTVKEAANRLANFAIDAKLDEAEVQDVSIGDSGVVMPLYVDHCRSCRIGKSLFNQTEQKIMDIEEEFDEIYEREYLDQMAGGPIEEFADRVEKGLNGESD